MKPISRLSVIVAFSFSTLGASAAIYTWTGATDGDWTKTGNWDGNNVPVDTDLGTAALELDSSNASSDRIVFNASTSGNPIPTSNLPSLGGDPFQWQTQSTPEMDVLFGNLSFALPGFQGGVVTRDAWTTNIGDGDTGNGLASLTYVSTFQNGLVRDTHDSPSAATWNVNADGTFILDDSGTSVTFSYGTDRYAAININGGSVSVLAQLDMLRGSAALGPSYFDFTAVGGSLTAEFGTDFVDLAAVNSAVGAGLTFRSTNGQSLSATDNTDGTFTVSVVPEPSALIMLVLGASGLLATRRR